MLFVFEHPHRSEATPVSAGLPRRPLRDPLVGAIVLGLVALAMSNGCSERSAQPVQQPLGLPLLAPAGVSGSGVAQASPISPEPARVGPIVLHDVTAQSGITFCHTDGSSGRRYILETVASGLATFDYDGDGLVDIYFVNGAPLPGAEEQPPATNRLYRNLGGFCFQDITEAAGVGDTGFGLGVAVADYDNDGDPDLYVNNFARNVMYRNNGDGTFTEVAQQAGTAAEDAHRVGAGAAFLDLENDGLLDLFVANYLVFRFDQHVTNTLRGIPIYPVPEAFPRIPSILYRNRGEGTFDDVSRQSGIGLHPGKGMGMVAADYDNDGDTDVFVNNDGPPGNFLFRNDGRGRFDEVGAESGVAYSGTGLVHGAMGVDCGDYDRDGLLDFYVTSYQGQLATLYRNLGQGMFDDVTTRTGAGQASFHQVTWGCSLVDLDNDGYQDIFFGAGHLLDNVDQLDRTTSYLATPVVLRNTGAGRFVNVSAECGDGLARRSVARGVAFDDLDNDGRVDIVILNSRRPPTLLRNVSPASHHWLQVELRGTQSNRDAVGARVTLVAGPAVEIDEVHSGRGYQSHYGSRLYFGLGDRDHVDRVEVRWPGGPVEIFTNIPADRQVVLRQGEGETRLGAAAGQP